MEKLQNVFDYIYQKEGEAPWTFKEPPKELMKLVESGQIKPCKALDVGCGEGYISTYLTSKGFDVTGIDASGNAIKLAEKHAKEKGMDCRFMQMDWKRLPEIKGRFDFILDWRFLTTLTDEDERKKYVEIISELLNNRGKYMSVAFSGEFKKWGKGKIRKSPVGTILYLANNEHLEKLFGKNLEILEKRMIKLPEKGTRGDVTSYFFLMKKK